jgi:hypothetical protein
MLEVAGRDKILDQRSRKVSFRDFKIYFDFRDSSTTFAKAFS